MKVLLHYEDHEDTELWKSLKITLPKSWRTGPTVKLLEQFVESYNGSEQYGGKNPLDVNRLHLEIRQPIQGNSENKSNMTTLALDQVIADCIPDRADVYVRNGPSPTQAELNERHQVEKEQKQLQLKNTVQCTRFGCRNRFPPGGPYPECRYHQLPPVFHETAKYWSCCPTKKAYDWDSFQNIPGCQVGICTEIKENAGAKMFLGGTDLRESMSESVKLRSIDDFNRAQAAGGSEAAPVLLRLQNVLRELGIEKELYEQVVDGMRQQFSSEVGTEVEMLERIKTELGSRLKQTLKSIAAEQLRIK